MSQVRTFEDRIREIKAKTPNGNWSLCQFMGVTEREVLVAQTVHASVNNLDGKPKEAYSIRGNGVFSRGRNGLVDNLDVQMKKQHPEQPLLLTKLYVYPRTLIRAFEYLY